MTLRERFYKVTHFEKPDRLPMLEWAPFWDLTLRRWEGEGLPKNLPLMETEKFFGLESMVCLDACPRGRGFPGEVVRIEGDYEAVLPFLYKEESIDRLLAELARQKPAHDAGGLLIRLWLDGFFWFPRTLFGIEAHLFSFYDEPALLHRINADLSEFHLKTLDAVFSVLTPDVVNFAEDMSYNHGPMLSEECFDEFLLPYYLKTGAPVRERSVPLLVDSDGDVTAMLPWLARAKADGIFPLERQAGVDVAALRRDFPKLLMMGGFDKMVMKRGEAAMRAEFERLLPVMRSGGFINSVDHQTPPDVSIENYRIYVRLLEEYCKKAAE